MSEARKIKAGDALEVLIGGAWRPATALDATPNVTVELDAQEDPRELVGGLRNVHVVGRQVMIRFARQGDVPGCWRFPRA